MIRYILLLALFIQACQPAKTAGERHPYTNLTLDTLTEQEKIEAERLLKEAFDEALSKAQANAPISEKVIRLHWWVHTHLYQVDPEPPLSLLKILRQRRGQCGSSSWVFQLLASRLKLETRSLGMFCIPRQNGHVGAEVFYDGAWHYFDPSFGVFFTVSGRIDGPVASLNDILAFPGLVDTNIFYPISYGRLGWNYPPMKAQSLNEMFKREQPGYQSTWGNYVLFLANACGAIVYESGNRIELPYRVSLANELSHELGTVDGSFGDISLHYTGNLMYDATGQYVIGDNSSSLGPIVVDHRYLISGNQRGDVVKITLYRTLGASARGLRFQAFGAVIDSINYVGDDSAEVTLQARAPTIELKSQSEGDERMFFDAVLFQRIPK